MLWQLDLENYHTSLQAFIDFFLFIISYEYISEKHECQKPLGISVPAMDKQILNFCLSITCNLRCEAEKQGEVKLRG